MKEIGVSRNHAILRKGNKCSRKIFCGGQQLDEWCFSKSRKNIWKLRNFSSRHDPKN